MLVRVVVVGRKLKLPRIIPMSESCQAFWELGLCLTKVLLLIALHFSTTVNSLSTLLRLFARCCTRFCLCIPLDFPHSTSCLSSVFHCLLSVVCPRSLVVCGWVSGVRYQSFVMRGLSFKVHCSVHSPVNAFDLLSASLLAAKAFQLLVRGLPHTCSVHCHGFLCGAAPDLVSVYPPQLPGTALDPQARYPSSPFASVSPLVLCIVASFCVVLHSILHLSAFSTSSRRS